MTPDLDRLDRAFADREREAGARPAAPDVRGVAVSAPGWAAELLERIGALEDRLDVVHAAPAGIPAWVDHVLARLDALQDRVDAATLVRSREDVPAWADELRQRVEALEATVHALRNDLLGPH
jgi:BMFP domain-containing protein YqiC